ncbi:hypothetical protein [Bradyrhizobium japonicum]|uniref:hypothetical protein n=1 Tax=Bradyrhizobium japonicum TaxID=375 RepID=UPI001FDA7FCB|nr:hypothetical protein [Bradyrhizobium japonicum]
MSIMTVSPPASSMQRCMNRSSSDFVSPVPISKMRGRDLLVMCSECRCRAKGARNGAGPRAG